MSGKSDKIFIIILYLVLFSVMVSMVLQNLEDPWLVILLSGMLVVLFTLRNAVLYGSHKYKKAGALAMLLDILIIFIISGFEKSAGSQIFYFTLIADACIAYSYLFSLSITTACFISFVSERFYHSNWPSSGFLQEIALNLLAFLSVYALMYIAKYEIRQKEKLSDIMFQLKIKTKQLEGMYIKLKDASTELEDVTALRERNRIAREIHDTVGHTLTTVLMEMEAGERLLKTDQALAIEKLGLAKAQVRQGLNDIRSSVRTLQSGKEILDFTESLKLLISEFTKHGDICIREDISRLPPLDQNQEKALYRALQEGLTNGIKHGGSTAFVFILRYENNNVKFLLQDNGSGTDSIVPGFGLTSMHERIKELGGIFSVNSIPGEGFSIQISIPVVKEEKNGTHTDIAG